MGNFVSKGVIWACGLMSAWQLGPKSTPTLGQIRQGWFNIDNVVQCRQPISVAHPHDDIELPPLSTLAHPLSTLAQDGCRLWTTPLSSLNQDRVC